MASALPSAFSPVLFLFLSVKHKHAGEDMAYGFCSPKLPSAFSPVLLLYLSLEHKHAGEDMAYGFCSPKLAASISTSEETMDLEAFSAIDKGMMSYGVLSCSSNGHVNVNGQLGPPLVHMPMIHSEASQNGFDHMDSEDSEDSEEEESDGTGENEAGAGLGNGDDENVLMIFETNPIGSMRLVDRRDKRTLPTMASFCTWIHQCWVNSGNNRVAAQVPDRRNLWPGSTVRVYEGGPNNAENLLEEGLDEIAEGWEYSFFIFYVRRVEVQLLIQPNQEVPPNEEMLIQPKQAEIQPTE